MAGTELRGVMEDVNVREVNDLIQSGDKRLTIAAADLAVAPSTADRVLQLALLRIRSSALPLSSRITSQLPMS
jgi:hypothetical protein